MNPTTELMRLSADCFSTAIQTHHAQEPEACKRLLDAYRDGNATPQVIIEPGQDIKCGFRIGDDVVIFARMPVSATPPADWH